ncbi:uncharacterized protein BDV17DRAFT_295747 [Aspergillus undulatus]|uniref:uncharacterized protein n=1 Tax=Aspergillus undulatus TaxID=1810928 RepID=UPI003CCCDB42
MIQDYVTKPLEEVGQTWSLYKVGRFRCSGFVESLFYQEVGKYWEAGMKVSELTTLMCTDDNFGAGVYYHLGYVGDPRSYDWISTNQLAKPWEQMHIADQRQAREIWVVNVQDLKG